MPFNQPYDFKTYQTQSDTPKSVPGFLGRLGGSLGKLGGSIGGFFKGLFGGSVGQSETQATIKYPTGGQEDLGTATDNRSNRHQPGVLSKGVDALGQVSNAVGTTNELIQGGKTLSQNLGFNQPPSQSDQYNTFMDSAFPGTTQWERLAGGAGSSGISAQSSRDVAKINAATQLSGQANSRDMLGRQLTNQLAINAMNLVAQHGQGAIPAIELAQGLTGKTLGMGRTGTAGMRTGWLQNIHGVKDKRTRELDIRQKGMESTVKRQGIQSQVDLSRDERDRALHYLRTSHMQGTPIGTFAIVRSFSPEIKSIVSMALTGFVGASTAKIATALRKPGSKLKASLAIKNAGRKRKTPLSLDQSYRQDPGGLIDKPKGLGNYKPFPKLKVDPWE